MHSKHNVPHQTYEVSRLRLETHAFGLCLTLTRTATIFSRIGARPGKKYKITQYIAKSRLCVQKTQSTMFAQSSACTQFIRVTGAAVQQSANVKIAHAFVLPAGSAKFGRAQNAYCAQVFPDSFSKFVKCAPLAKTQQAEEVSGGFWTSILVDFIFILGGNNLTQSYLHINHQHLLCTSCEF